MGRLRGPRSLLWRLGALALAVTLVSLLLHVTVITIWIRPVGDKLMGQLAARAHITRALLESTPQAQRDRLAPGVSDPEFLLSRGAASPPSREPLPIPLGPLLTQRLGPAFDAWVEADEVWSFEPRRLWIGFEVDQQPWQIRVLAQPPIWAVLGTGIGWLVLAAVAVGASFLVGLRFIVGPIRQVAQRIAGQGATLAAVPVPAGSSSEVRSLVESFNRLVEKVRSADRTKQQLLAGVSHDLRTPLSRLRLRIETQCEPRVAADAEEELQAVEHIVAQFLAFVHGESGAGMGARQSVLLAVDQVVGSYARQGVNIAFVIAAPDASQGQLSVQRLLSNLIDNALTHGEQPIEIAWRAPAPDVRELSVWDRGIGLDPKQFEAALEPFVRLSKDAPIGHCGLGLAIVAQIAQQWQATLACRRDEDGRFGVVVTWRLVDGRADAPVTAGA
jgi:two-component system, OmpR family, osmolarity sensor histidine kinase EnvZ